MHLSCPDNLWDQFVVSGPMAVRPLAAWASHLEESMACPTHQSWSPNFPPVSFQFDDIIKSLELILIQEPNIKYAIIELEGVAR